MSASRTGSKTIGDKTRYTFKQDNLVPSYLVAIAAGQMEGRRIGPRSTVWGEPGVVDKKLKKHEFNFFSSLKKLKNMDLIFCKLKKAQKTWI